MSPRWMLLRDLCLFALGIGVGIVVLIASVLRLGGLFSWVWFAHAVLFCAFVVCILEWLVVQHVRRVTLVQGPLGSWRGDYHSQGCSVALLGALVALGLLLCGGLMEWLVDTQ